ncbi:type 4a pilus biogenesis protein PilO [Actinoplanes sp. NPDC051859]|uniref:type 4a pilus biogenesis protein PilO n=1 Tax=Actinoplanes sp. NPDC051859 TaxID=3363909 RepID=UPI003795D2A9
MRTGHADRLWLIIGFAAAALLVVVTYFAVISTTSTTIQSLEDSAQDAQTRTITLRREISKLEETDKQKKQITATRDAYRKALPENSGVPAFLRQLQSQGFDVDANVSELTVADPEEVKGLPGVWGIPIQLVAKGKVKNLRAFLEKLQGSSKERAVLIENAEVAVKTDDGGNQQLAEAEQSGRLDLGIQVFVAPPVGAGAPTVTTD